MSGVFTNEDCMEVMKRYPDKFFDIAIVDPPYGGGAQGMNGTSAKEEGSEDASTSTTSRPAMNTTRGSLRPLRHNLSRRAGRAGHGRRSTQGVSLTMIFATGTSPHQKSTSMSYSASARTKSFGAGTTSIYRRLGASSYGTRRISRFAASPCPPLSMRGLA